MTTRAEREEENRKFLKAKVDVHLNKLIIELLKRKPENVLGFINTWSTEELAKGGASNDNATGNSAYQVNDEALNTETIDMTNVPKEDKGDYVAPDVDSDDEADDETEAVPDLDANLKANKKQSNIQRASVSAEVFGMNNAKKAYEPKIIEKSDEAKARIQTRLDQAFMFANLDNKEKTIVLNAMEEHTFKKDDCVIKQGDDGDVLFCVDSGKLNCYRKMKKDDEAPGQFLKAYQPGEAFGELALLYNAPRAATIIADEDSVCFSLDRDCFNNIVKEATIKRRERFEEFVNKVELMQDLDPYERGQLADVLTTQTFQDGDTIIKQGEAGDKFYLIESGTCKAVKGGSGEEEIVYEYQENDYFGELALLRDDVRAASVIATSEVMVAWIERNAFKRLLGPIEEVLKRNTDRYDKFVKSA